VCQLLRQLRIRANLNSSRSRSSGCSWAAF
jgi:hypothetical protein